MFVGKVHFGHNYYIYVHTRLMYWSSKVKVTTWELV